MHYLFQIDTLFLPFFGRMDKNGVCSLVKYNNRGDTPSEKCFFFDESRSEFEFSSLIPVSVYCMLVYVYL
jgi:hypothetical protein